MASSESFEAVGEVSREFEADGGVDWLHAMVLNTQLLVQGAHPQKLPPCQMQGAHRQTHAAFAAEIGIGESHRKLVVIVAYRRDSAGMDARARIPAEISKEIVCRRDTARPLPLGWDGYRRTDRRAQTCRRASTPEYAHR